MPPLRRLLLLLPLALLLAAAGCGADDPETPGAPEEPPPAEPTAPPEDPDDVQLEQECTNDELGYTVRYPRGWQTNAGDVVPACSFFDPDEIEVPEATEFLDAAVMIRRDPVELEDVAGEGPGITLLEREDTRVNGQDAVRRETEATGDGLLPEGVRGYQYLVRVDGGTLFVETYEVGDLDYDRNREVVDAMVETLELTDPAEAGAAPVGEPQTGLVDLEPSPGLEAEAHLTDVRVARHAGSTEHPSFDRIVFELAGDEPPGMRARYTEPPIVDDPAGRPLEVEGEAFLEVSMSPATGVDLTGDKARETYTGRTPSPRTAASPPSSSGTRTTTARSAG